jgi:hypothetical protein
MAVAADGCSFAQRQTTPAYKAAQTILFGAAPALTVGGVGAITASGGGSGNPVVFTSLTASLCTVAGGTVAGLAVGTCVLAANQAGNASFNAAPQATLTISVGRAVGFALTVRNANTAGGTVVSDAGGIACGPSCSAAFDAGATVRLSAIPADGYQFSGWGGDCRPCGYGNACALAMSAAQSCTADFEPFKRRRPLWMRLLPPQ